MNKKRYAQVGVGSRARFYYEAIVTTFSKTSDMVGFCDVNQTRMDYANSLIEELGHGPLPTYKAENFDEMIKETKPDVVIVTSVDRTHHKYIIRAMELGCDVITEKPMTIDEIKAAKILKAIEKYNKKLTVAFNYRYAPYHSKIKEIVMNETIGKVNSIHFEWLLNTSHGADYFRRWHRDKRNSGGLLVHKSTHHFDLVNFWLNSRPTLVYALGDLMFYGKENAENRGVKDFYYRAYGNEFAKNDPFALHMQDNETLKGMYLDAEHEDGYFRDKSVFSDDINIEDTLGVIVKYESNTILTYSLNAYTPWEGFRVALNGTKGRVELEVREKIYVNGAGEKEQEGAADYFKIIIHPMFERSYEVEIDNVEGGHGGGDPVLLDDLFGQAKSEGVNRVATYIDGATSILTGIAANKSMATNMPVKIKDLMDIPE